jgi:predicted kinase
METVTILVGTIAAGKSTLCRDKRDIAQFSRDELRKIFAAEVGKEYIYDLFIEKRIDKMIKAAFESLLYLGVKDIIIDETNITIEDRKYFITKAKEFGYVVKAIVFPDLGEDIHVERRLSNNHGDVSEQKWREVYREKKERYEEPTKEEGFDEVEYYES